MRAATFTLTVALLAQASAPAPPVARPIADGTWLVPGAMLPNRGPDGNTVVLRGPEGLVVVDTGRHAWHSDGILAFAKAQGAPVRAIVNTHWHLDHSSGNRRITAAYPGAKVYTTPAIDRALAPGGFLARNADTARHATLPADAPATQREERAIFLDTMEAAEALRPDVPLTRNERRTLAGRPLDVRVANDAVTDGDVWLFDEATGVAVIGDLVTLPAPFFETACPARWQAALDEVWATPFRLAVPGHGAPMTRAQFDQYRKAFAAFRACVGGDGAPKACADAWTRDVGTLLADDAERKQAGAYAAYYVEFLRKDGGTSADCRAK